MKNLLITLALFFFLADFTSAQSEINKTEIPKALSMTYKGILLGVWADKYPNMTLEGMKAMAIDAPQFNYNLDNYDEQRYFTGVIGLNISGYLSFSPYSHKKQQRLVNQEFRVGLGLGLGREAMIEYERDNAPNPDDELLTFCLMENDLSASVGYYWRFTKPERALNFYAGIGSNASASFSNAFLLIKGSRFDEPEVKVKAKPSYYTRVFAEGGIIYSLPNDLNLTFGIRQGRGWQFITDGHTQDISSAFAVNFGVEWVLE